MTSKTKIVDANTYPSWIFLAAADNFHRELKAPRLANVLLVIRVQGGERVAAYKDGGQLYCAVFVFDDSSQQQ